MIRKSFISAIVLALALSACSKKAPDHCKTHTGDGLCADGPSGANDSIIDNASVLDNAAVANVN